MSSGANETRFSKRVPGRYGSAGVVLDKPADRAIVWVIFLPCALLNVWSPGSFFAPGDANFAGASILTGPGSYLPRIVSLTSYAFIVRRLWAAVVV